MATSFIDVRKLFTTTKGGPPLCDVRWRKVWTLSSGQVIADCIVDDTADKVLNRSMEYPDDIRIELVRKHELFVRAWQFRSQSSDVQPAHVRVVLGLRYLVDMKSPSGLDA